MRTLAASSAILACAAALLANDCRADGNAATSGSVCAGKVESMAHCRWIDGTLKVYNGTPPIRILRRGSRQIYAVGPAEQEWMPQDLRSRLTPDKSVTARLRICPIHERPVRGMSEVCIDEARVHAVATPAERPRQPAHQ